MVLEQVPIKDVFGDPKGSVKVEESWSKDLPPETGANAPIEKPFDREKSIIEVGDKPSRRVLAMAQAAKAQKSPAFSDLSANGNGDGFVGRIEPSEKSCYREFHFFSINGTKMEFVGTKEIDLERFQRDISGLFLRNWMRKEFPNRRDYDRIACFPDDFTMVELADMMSLSGQGIE